MGFVPRREDGIVKQLAPDLWQSALYKSGVLRTHAYFLTRDDGNVLFYNTGDEDDLDQMESLGGVSLQLLTHRDEAGPPQAVVRKRFGARLGCSAIEMPSVSKHSPVDIELGTQVDAISDIVIVHTPGHTDGSICFFYASLHGGSYLFTGDTIFLWDGQWSTLVLDHAGGSAAALAESLGKLKAYSPDLVMSSGFVGEEAYRWVTLEEWTAALDGRIAHLSGKT